MHTIASMIRRFEQYLLTEQRVSHNTFSSYKRDLQQFELFLIKHSWDITRIGSDELKQFIHYLYGLKLKARSIGRKISALKAFFNYIHTKFGIENSAQELCFPKIEKNLPAFLSEQEVRMIFDYAEKDTSSLAKRTTIMLYLLYMSGMRVSELINLSIEDFHFDTGFITVVGKGNKQRMLPLPASMISLINSYIKELESFMSPEKKRSRYLFVVIYNKKVKPISRQSCWLIIKKLCVDAGIGRPVSPHQLRHSFATHMLKNGADLRSLQLLLGHQSINTVEVYTHVDTSHLRKIYDKKHPRS